MDIVTLFAISGMIMWFFLFVNACTDMYHTYVRVNSRGENELVNWTVEDYGTSLGDEYGEDEL